MNVSNILSSGKRKVVGAVVALGLGLGGLAVGTAGPKEIHPQELQALVAKGSTEPVKVKLQCADAYCNFSGLVIVKNTKYPQNPTMTVVVPASSVPGAVPGKKVSSLVGKQLTAVGVPSEYNGVPQVKAERFER